MNVRKLFVFLLLCISCAAAPARAEDPLDKDDPLLAGHGDKNVRLRLQLDRVAIQTCEPVYLAVSADRFADTVAPDIQVRPKDQAPIYLGALQGQWVVSEKQETPQRMRILLVSANPGPQSRFLFNEPGEYRLRVKIGPDFTSLQVSVVPGKPDDDKAFGELGPDNFNAMLTETRFAVPPPQLVKAVQTVAHNHPDSLAATYCRGYLATAAFKDAARIYQHAGGKPVWGPIAQQLQASFQVHNGDCFGEELGFYAAWAQGLGGDYPAAIQTIDSVRTRVTFWADMMTQMKLDIAMHLRPAEVPPVKKPGR